MWCVLLLSSLAVAAQQEQFEVDASDVDEEAGLYDEELKVLMADEEEAAEEEEEEATLVDENHSDETDGTASGKDANVSFQVRNGSEVIWRNDMFLFFYSCGSVNVHPALEINFWLVCSVPQVTYKTPVPTGDVYFAETFDDGSLERYGRTPPPPKGGYEYGEHV